MRRLIKAVGRRVHQLGSHNLQTGLRASKGRGKQLQRQRGGILFEPLKPQTLRWGIAPVTLLAEDFVNALSILPIDQHEVTGCVDAYRSQSLEFADRHRVPHIFTSFEQLARCPDVDAVYISPSNARHCELCHLMLNHDKHVLCEQPLAMSEQQVTELVNKARARGLFMMEGIWPRCTPAYRTLRNQLQHNKLGRVYHVDCSLGRPLTQQLMNFAGNAGVTRNLAPFALQLALWVFREVPLSVQVRGKLDRQGVDVANTIDLFFSDNRTTRLRLSTLEGLSNVINIFGQNGNAKLNNIWCPDQLALDDVDYSFLLPKSKQPANYQNRICLCYEAQEVRNCILAGRTQSDLFSHHESRLMANLIHQIHDMLREQFENVQAMRKFKEEQKKLAAKRQEAKQQKLQKETQQTKANTTSVHIKYKELKAQSA